MTGGARAPRRQTRVSCLETYPMTDGIGTSRPLQNRVLPTGEIVAKPARGRFTGNRGILHRPDGTLGVARWRHPHWIICTLTHPRGRYHGPMPARGWTALFFLDEAVALAAGHRPGGYCRRAEYRAWREAWAAATGARPDRTAMDGALHRARVTRRRAQRRHEAALETLPDGAFVGRDGAAWLVLGRHLLRFGQAGYGPAVPREAGPVEVLTPAPSLAVLGQGYRPDLHPSALRPGRT
jgi:hypothetical protein